MRRSLLAAGEQRLRELHLAVLAARHLAGRVRRAGLRDAEPGELGEAERLRVCPGDCGARIPGAGVSLDLGNNRLRVAFLVLIGHVVLRHARVGVLDAFRSSLDSTDTGASFLALTAAPDPVTTWRLDWSACVLVRLPFLRGLSLHVGFS